MVAVSTGSTAAAGPRQTFLCGLPRSALHIFTPTPCTTHPPRRRTANRRAFLLNDVSKITIFGSNSFKQ